MNREAGELYGNEEKELTQKEFDELFPLDQWIDGGVGSRDDVSGNEERGHDLILDSKFRGKYDINNSTLAVVGPDGHVRVAPLTHARWESIKKGGLRQGGFGVPFSSGSSPSDESLRKKWDAERAAAMEDYKKNGPVRVE